jgi:hypothetical protein
MRAFFSKGADKMHIPWAVEGLPTLLHLSLFLFFGGLAIFLFNIDHTVFSSVIWWIALFSIVYGLITVMPIVWNDSPYYAPLSQSAWFLYAGMNYVLVKFFASKSRRGNTFESWQRFSTLKHRYHSWMLGGVEKAAEGTVSERSSEIDIRIFDWTIGVLGEDDSLEKFFEAVPGFFNSKLVKHLGRDFPDDILTRFWSALNQFMNRTSLSNSVNDSVKFRRAIICMDIMSLIPCPFSSRYGAISDFFDQAPVSIERLRAMAPWRFHKNDHVADYARVRVAKNLASMPKRDDNWIALASSVCGLATHDLRDNIAHAGNNLLLSTLVDFSRRTIHSPSHDLQLVKTLTQFDIRNTLPGLQHDFCALWNELVQEARNRERDMNPDNVLRGIRHLYNALHQGTSAAPTAFSCSTTSLDFVWYHPSSYPLCNIASHRPDSTAHVPVSIFHGVPPLTQPAHSPDTPLHHSTSSGSTVSRQAKEESIIAGPLSSSNPTASSALGDRSQAPAATSPALPVHTIPHPTDTGAITPVLKDVSLVAASSHPLEETTRQDKVPPCAEPDINGILSTASMPAPTATLVPVTASIPPVLNKSLSSCDAGAASTSKLLSLASIRGFSAPDSPLPLTNAEFLSSLGGMSTKGPSDSATLPRLHPRRLVNNGNMSVANAVLQLLVNCPPFRDLFRDLGRPVGQREGETGGGATPLVDATIRFFDEEEKKEIMAVDSFEPTYMYDAMKEKRQLKDYWVRSRATWRPAVTDLCGSTMYRTADSRMRKSFS